MGQEIRTCVAGADLSAKQYYVVKLTTKDTIKGNPKVVLGGAATDNLYGIIKEGAASGYGVTVCYGGEFLAKLGGTVAAGDKLVADANGKLIAGSTPATDVIFATALEAGADGEVVRVAIDKK